MSYYNPTTSSGLKTADGAITPRPAILKSIMLRADGTNAASLILYDNATAASGNVLATIAIPATGVYEFWACDHGPEALFGIYADVTGTGASFVVHYSAK